MISSIENLPISNLQVINLTPVNNTCNKVWSAVALVSFGGAVVISAVYNYCTQKIISTSCLAGACTKVIAEYAPGQTIAFGVTCVGTAALVVSATAFLWKR